MRIIESNFSELILSSKKINLGEIYFFNDLAVVELNEGVHIDSSNSYKIFEELNNYFGNSKPFGLIANRVNSYSVDIIDVISAIKKINNLYAYTIVTYNLAGKMNAEIENSFYNNGNKNYHSLSEAFYVASCMIEKHQLACSH